MVAKRAEHSKEREPQPTLTVLIVRYLTLYKRNFSFSLMAWGGILKIYIKNTLKIQKKMYKKRGQFHKVLLPIAPCNYIIANY